MNILILWFAALLIFRPVPLSQVTAFLAVDKTNDNHSPGRTCTYFSDDLTKNARFAGIEAYRVDVLFAHQTIRHSIIAFKTTDQGVVYVEPQTDDIYYHVAVGNELCTQDKNLCVGNGEVIRKLLTTP